jgi:hypothetical protein
MSVTDGNITADLAEHTLRIDGASSTPLSVSVSQGGNTANVAVPDPNLGAALLVSSGQLVSTTTLSAVTGNATGTTMDAGSAHANCTVVCVGTSTLTGTITIEGSVDGTTFVSTGTTVALTAAATVTASSSAKAFRYYRASLSGSGGAGTATAKIMAS